MKKNDKVEDADNADTSDNIVKADDVVEAAYVVKADNMHHHTSLAEGRLSSTFTLLSMKTIR